ncbi:HAD family hydrolase [Candidatus Dojkabacteria bacterium]|uniref:HAD family hydrolase n=1 Tax=Candidatus Dojkabacteria bacterium TaxID=2099670 RepID=A0A955L643_9BACT|nr:HAD family hydrolase [Candidatus Dojkabacteria bacterium]
MKKYKAIFFDWDGTAVLSRTEDAKKVVGLINKHLERNTPIFIISGTNYQVLENQIFKYISLNHLNSLYFGTDRGAFCYGFEDGKRIELVNNVPDNKVMADIHEVAFKLHRLLFEKYNYNTNIVFTRPNYCKLDLLVEIDRGSHKYISSSEIDILENIFKEHKIPYSLAEIIDLTKEIAQKDGLELQITSDAKYLEIGPSTKSDNINYFFSSVLKEKNINPAECAVWGDEFVYISEGLKGSDAHMITDITKDADFFDVSSYELPRPENVKNIGGGVETFINFLEEQLS